MRWRSEMDSNSRYGSSHRFTNYACENSARGDSVAINRPRRGKSPRGGFFMAEATSSRTRETSSRKRERRSEALGPPF